MAYSYITTTMLKVGDVLMDREREMVEVDARLEDGFSCLPCLQSHSFVAFKWRRIESQVFILCNYKSPCFLNWFRK